MESLVSSRRALLAAAALGLLVLGASFAPWFQHEYTFAEEGARGVRTDSANAWNASWWWAGGCGLGCLAAVLALRLRVLIRRGWLTAAAALLSLSAVAAVLMDYLPLLRRDDGGGEGYFTYATLTQGDGGNPMAVRRGMLAVVNVDGDEARVGWGLYVGLGLLVAQVLTLAAVALTTKRRATRADAPDGG